MQRCQWRQWGQCQRPLGKGWIQWASPEFIVFPFAREVVSDDHIFKGLRLHLLAITPVQATYLWGEESRKRGWSLQVGLLEESWELGGVQQEGIGSDTKRGKHRGKCLNHNWHIIFDTERNTFLDKATGNNTCFLIWGIKTIIGRFFWQLETFIVRNGL